jgi:hypothetical protein
MIVKPLTAAANAGGTATRAVEAFAQELDTAVAPAPELEAEIAAA